MQFDFIQHSYTNIYVSIKTLFEIVHDSYTYEYFHLISGIRPLVEQYYVMYTNWKDRFARKLLNKKKKITTIYLVTFKVYGIIKL